MGNRRLLLMASTGKLYAQKIESSILKNRFLSVGKNRFEISGKQTFCLTAISDIFKFGKSNFFKKYLNLISRAQVFNHFDTRLDLARV